VTCPGSPMAASCPPLAKYLSNIRMGMVKASDLMGRLCHNHCSERPGREAIKLEHTASLPDPDSGAFAIVGLAHPLTYLAAAEMDGKVTADKARDDLESRDQVVKVLTDKFIPYSKVGNDYRVLLAKDSIHSPLYRSNSTWFIWESFAGDIDNYNQILEWDLGFSFHKVDPKMLEKVSIDSLDLDETGKTDLSTVLKQAKKRVLAAHPDQDVETTASWNPMESEIWQFVRGWNDRVASSIKKMSDPKYKGSI
jgi:hypothetical protein